MFYDTFVLLCKEAGIARSNALKDLSISSGILSKWKGGSIPSGENLSAIADYFGVSTDYLLGRVQSPNITDDFVTFPVVCEIAAGFDQMGTEWEGEKIDIPRSYIHGAPKDYAVIKIKGDSMFPDFRNGDRVLLKKQPSLDYSGQVGVLIYEDCTTLKRVEFKQGEDWLIMRPINPNFPPQRIEGVDLEQCRVVGVPKLLIREVAE